MGMKVGVVGLGAMGGGIAKNLIEKGFEVVVRDVKQELVNVYSKKGATAAKTAKETGVHCEVVLTSLPMSPVVPSLEQEILAADGILEGMEPGKIIVDCGNTSPLTAKQLGQQCEKRSVFFLDAPVSGGPTGAEAGALSVMVGGPPEAFKRASAIFQAIARKVTYFGPNGSGQMAKLVNNMIVALNLATISEALVFGQKAGLEPEKLYETIAAGAAQSWVLDTYGKSFLHRAPGHKDEKEEYREKQLGWAFQIATELEIPIPMTVCAHELYKSARASGKTGTCEPIMELWESLTGTFFSRGTK
jgi:2-hydroxy-3-oxopropionate reductase